MARTLKNTFLHWTRALHTYVTMLALILLIFFSFTGFLLNHPKWFSLDDYQETDQVARKNMPEKLVSARGGIGTEHGYQVEAYLRQNEGAKGELSSIDDLDDSIVVHFTAVGWKMDYTINRLVPAVAEPAAGAPGEAAGNEAAAPAGPDGGAAPKALGSIDEHFEVRSVLALMSDMHRGIGSGGSWRLFIDATAIFLAFASLSGLVLWISMPKRRRLGLVALVASVALCGACYLFLLA